MLRITGLFAVLLLALAISSAGRFNSPTSHFFQHHWYQRGLDSFTSPTVYELSETNIPEGNVQMYR